MTLVLKISDLNSVAVALKPLLGYGCVEFDRT